MRTCCLAFVSPLLSVLSRSVQRPTHPNLLLLSNSFCSPVLHCGPVCLSGFVLAVAFLSPFSPP
jgi:hypothetical protein